MNDRHTDIKLITKLFFRLLPIQILLGLVSAVNGTISGLFGSNFVGADVMSAIGLYAPISMFLSAVCIVFVAGSQIVCGRYMGRGESERTQDVFSLDLLAVSFFSLLVIAVLAVGAAAGLTRVFTADPATRTALDQYILGQVIGILPMLLGQQLSAFLSLENQTKRTTSASLICIAVTLVMNYLLVVVLKMKAFGLALSSSLGLWTFFAVQLTYYFSGRSFLKLRFDKIEWGVLKDILTKGYPGALNNGYQTIRGIIVNGLIIRYVGNAGLSAFSASDSILRLFWTIPFGMMVVSRMLISIFIGEEDRKSLTDVMRVAMYKCVPLMCCISAVIMACAVPFTRLFYRDPSDPVYGMTVMAFRLLPICMPLSIISLHFSCYAQASGKQVLVHVLSALDGVICVAGFSAILVPSLLINGVYIANILNGVVCALAVWAYSILVRKRFPRNMEGLMAIPEDFGAEDDARIDISVKDLEGVMAVSERVIGFCKARGVDERRANFSGLFLEEMAVNVVDHGFRKDKKPHTVDIRVVCKAEDVILRLRDDCIPFDPAERLEVFDPNDEMKNAAIRMVYKMAKKIDYQNILGLNELTIRI